MQNLCFCTDVCPLLPRRAPGRVGQPHKQAWLCPQRDSALGSVSLRPVASLRRRTGGCRDPPRLTQHRPRAASLPPGGSAHSAQDPVREPDSAEKVNGRTFPALRDNFY